MTVPVPEGADARRPEKGAGVGGLVGALVGAGSDPPKGALSGVARTRKRGFWGISAFWDASIHRTH